MGAKAASHRARRAGRVVEVSQELTIIVGQTRRTRIALPKGVVGIAIDAAAEKICFVPNATVSNCMAAVDTEESIALFVDVGLLLRLRSRFPHDLTGITIRLPADIRSVALAALNCSIDGDPGDIYCTAKAVELLCEIAQRIASNDLAPHEPSLTVSRADTVRIARAKRFIDERWRDTITINTIASHCGVNREKLTRVFKSLFHCSISEAIAERRLTEASRMLVASELSVGSVGYESGYLSNTSFSRAFARRFGMPPGAYRSHYRGDGI